MYSPKAINSLQFIFNCNQICLTIFLLGLYRCKKKTNLTIFQPKKVFVKIQAYRKIGKICTENQRNIYLCQRVFVFYLKLIYLEIQRYKFKNNLKKNDL